MKKFIIISDVDYHVKVAGKIEVDKGIRKMLSEIRATKKPEIFKPFKDSDTVKIYCFDTSTEQHNAFLLDDFGHAEQEIPGSIFCAAISKGVVAMLVEYSIVTRVVVGLDSTDEEVIKASKAQFVKRVNSDDFGDNVVEVAEDEEMPYSNDFDGDNI